MEESGENWPSDSDLEISDDVIFEDGEYEDHYCSESGNPTDRKRRNTRNEREVAEKLLALSPTILKKMDDSSIIEKVKNYVKQLQERVRELEQEVGSNNICSNKDTTSCKMNSHDYNCGTTSNILPEVKARVLQKEILIIIHCEKQKDVMLKILTHLENLHLSLVNSSVLLFGKSNLDITIIAQMDDGYNIKLDELVQTLRLAIST